MTPAPKSKEEKPELAEVKDGEMYCAIDGCGRVDKTHSAYCFVHGRSPHRIKGEKN